MTLPIPIWKLKGFWPGSFVDQNGTDRSRFFPYPGVAGDEVVERGQVDRSIDPSIRPFFPVLSSSSIVGVADGWVMNR